jgi:hypothetical protein
VGHLDTPRREGCSSGDVEDGVVRLRGGGCGGCE